MGSHPPHKSKFAFSALPWRRWGLALFALAWFWLVALQVATGFLDQYLASNDTRRAGIVTIVDGVVDRFLVEPLGQPLAAVVLLIAGVLAFVFMLKFKKDQ